MDRHKKLLSWVGGIAGAVVLGAIGSGVWERCLSQLFDHAVRLIVSGMSLVSNTYKNRIYEEAAKGLHESLSVFVLGLMLALVAVGWLALVITHPVVKKKDEFEDKVWAFVRSDAGYLAMIVVWLAVSLSSLLKLGTSEYINDVATVTRQSITMLAPHITDSDVKDLWALYSSMTSENDFDVFKAKLETIASEKGVTLPPYPGLWTRKTDGEVKRSGEPPQGSSSR